MFTGFSKRQVLILISAGLVLSTLAAYEPIRHNDFINFDDDVYITKNNDVQHGLTRDSVIWAFTKSCASNWHPLTWLSHMLDCRLFGLNPMGHHLVSVLIHIINAMLIFWILNNMTGAFWASAFVAGVFALHPLQVESVAWVSERKTVLSGLFWLLTTAVYIWYARKPGIGRYLLVFVIYGLSIMTKPVVVTLPLVLLLLDYWPLERIRRRKTDDGRQMTEDGGLSKSTAGWLIIEKIPLLVLSGISSVITVIAQRSVEAIVSLGKLPMGYRFTNAFVSYIRYIGKMIWPSGLASPYPVTIMDTNVVIGCTLLFVLLLVLSILVGRRKRYLATGWLWFVGTLVPMIGLVQVGSQSMADRYMYLSMIGLLFIIVWGIKDITADHLRLRGVMTVSVCAILPILAILTHIQAGYWQNDLTLFAHTLKVTSKNPFAENSYAFALAEIGKDNEAMLHWSNVIRLLPMFDEARINLGKGYLKQGKPDEAIACFQELLRQKQDNAEVHYSWALALSMQKKYEEALEHFARALEIDPNHPNARKRMGVTLLLTGRINEAIEYFNKLLQQKEDTAEVHYNWALALSSQKKYEDAVKHLARVLELDPNHPDARNLMGVLQLAEEKAQEAVARLNEALRIRPDQAELYIKLGKAYNQLGKNELAIRNWTKAVEIEPDSIPVLNNLAWLLATTGDVSKQDAEKAIKYAQHCCELTGYKSPNFLDTLAAAYAAAGRFEDAVNTAKKAVDAAKANNQEDLTNEIQSRIKLYQDGHPYHQK